MFAHKNKPISPNNLTFQFFHKNYDGTKGNPIPYHEDDTDGKLYVFRHEFGVMCIVCAMTFSDAHEVFIDEQPTIEPDELAEAHNAYDKLREHLIEKGHEDTAHLREFCTRFDSLYFYLCTFNANDRGAWDEWPLDEAYEMQSNCSGTGIVNVGHYLTQEVLTPAMMEREEILCELSQNDSPWSPD